MRIALLLALCCSCFRAAAPGDEVAIHMRPGGHECMAPCGVRGVNFNSQECGVTQEFVPAFLAAVAANTDISGPDACRYLQGHDIVITDADPEGSFSVGHTWVNGITDCYGRLTFLGLPPGNPKSFATHELLHVLDCRIRDVKLSQKHDSWEHLGYCNVIRNTGSIIDECSEKR